MATERFTRSPAFRVALWSGLSAGPVLAVVWPIFVRLESGEWPLELLPIVLAMLTLGTLTGLGAGLTLMLPALSLLNVRPGPRLRWVAAGVGAGVCLLLIALFGIFSGVERLGAQWPLWLLLTIAGALCGWIGGLAVARGRTAPAD